MHVAPVLPTLCSVEWFYACGWFLLDLCFCFVDTRIHVESMLLDWGRLSEFMMFGLVASLGFLRNPYSQMEASWVISWCMVLFFFGDSWRIHLLELFLVEWYFSLCSLFNLVLWSFWRWCSIHEYMCVHFSGDLRVLIFCGTSRSYDHWGWVGNMHAHGHLS